MKVEVSQEQIEKLEKHVGFSIEDESDLEQAISLFIEIGETGYSKEVETDE